MEHTQGQFITFLGFIDVLSHPVKTGVIHMIGRRAQAPLINLLIIGYRELKPISFDTLLLTK